MVEYLRALRRPGGEKEHDQLIGSQIRVLRLQAGLSQKGLGERLGISFQQIQKYEKGANRISASRLMQIAAALDAPMDYFYRTLPGAAAVLRERPPDYDPVPEIFTPDSIALLHAFARIRDPALRNHLLALARALSARTPTPPKSN